MDLESNGESRNIFRILSALTMYMVTPYLKLGKAGGRAAYRRKKMPHFVCVKSEMPFDYLRHRVRIRFMQKTCLRQPLGGG